jgi:hypothetical protein
MGFLGFKDFTTSHLATVECETVLLPWCSILLDNFAKKHKTGMFRGNRYYPRYSPEHLQSTCAYHHCATFAVAAEGPRLNQDTGQPRCPSGSASLGLVFGIIAGWHDFELEKRQYPLAEEPPSYRTIYCSDTRWLLQRYPFSSSFVSQLLCASRT